MISSIKHEKMSPSLVSFIEMIYFVTGNDKKWAEIEAILGDSIDIVRSSIDLPEFQGASLEDIARMKAQTAHDRLKAPVIIEDTALAFDALNGLPGAYIKWFLDAIKCEGLAKMLDGFDNRSGSAICTIAYHNGTDVTIMQGVTRGRIAEKPQGGDVFGWDPIFIPTDHDASNQLSYAQIQKSLKNEISHRSKALKLLQAHFNQKQEE